MTSRLHVASIAACGVAGLAGSAHARGGEAFLSLSWIDTGNNNGLIEPGESAIITLSSLQVWDGQDPEYVAFGGAIIDVVTTDAGADVNGHTIMNGLANIDPPGDTAEENGGNLENASFFQTWFDYVTDNPIGLVRFQVEFTDYRPRAVTYATSLDDGFGVIAVLVRNSKGKFATNWPGFNDTMTITVLPAPAGMAAIGAILLAVNRRSRHSTS